MGLLETRNLTSCIPSYLLYRCIDFLRVSRFGGNGGVTESCGTDPGVNMEQLDRGIASIIK